MYFFIKNSLYSWTQIRQIECGMQSGREYQTCKFYDPWGRVLVLRCGHIGERIKMLNFIKSSTLLTAPAKICSSVLELFWIFLNCSRTIPIMISRIFLFELQQKLHEGQLWNKLRILLIRFIFQNSNRTILRQFFKRAKGPVGGG